MKLKQYFVENRVSRESATIVFDQFQLYKQIPWWDERLALDTVLGLCSTLVC